MITRKQTEAPMIRNRTRIGRVFGRLTVLEEESPSPSNDGNHYYRCACACGNEKTVRWKNMLKGRTKSCGCLYNEHQAEMKSLKEANLKIRAEKKSEKVALPRRGGHPLNSTYTKMIARCENKKHDSYRYYGARGVGVCARWRNDFWAFVEDMGPRPEGATLDRIDGNGNYGPDNCRWASKEIQYSNVRNTRPCYVVTLRGDTRLLVDWARKYKVDPERVKRDIKQGVAPDVALVSAVYRKKLYLARLPKAPTPEEYKACTAKAVAWLARANV